MAQVTAQPLVVTLVTSTIKVDISPAVMITRAQPLSVGLAGQNKTVVISPA